jgi:hypothetical protein
MKEEIAMAVTTDPLTGVFEADRTHSSFQFAVRHMEVASGGRGRRRANGARRCARSGSDARQPLRAQEDVDRLAARFRRRLDQPRAAPPR